MISIAIIDSELQSKEVLKSLLMEINSSDLQVVADGGTCREASQILRNLRPQVLFIEANLPDGTAFELLSHYKILPCRVVLFSRNREHALSAFEHSVLDFLLKPFTKGRLQQTILRLLDFNYHQDARLLPSPTGSNEPDPACALQRKIPVHVGMRVVLLNICDVVYFRSQDGNTLVRTKDQNNFTIGRQLSDFNYLFKTPSVFMRANKTTIINVNAVTSYSKGQVYLAYLQDGSEIEISRRKKTELLSLLDLKNSSN